MDSFISEETEMDGPKYFRYPDISISTASHRAKAIDEEARREVVGSDSLFVTSLTACLLEFVA